MVGASAEIWAEGTAAGVTITAMAATMMATEAGMVVEVMAVTEMEEVMAVVVEVATMILMEEVEEEDRSVTTMIRTAVVQCVAPVVDKDRLLTLPTEKVAVGDTEVEDMVVMVDTAEVAVGDTAGAVVAVGGSRVFSSRLVSSDRVSPRPLPSLALVCPPHSTVCPHCLSLFTVIVRI